MSSPELACYLPSGVVRPPRDAYGRLVANAGVLRALARHGGYEGLTMLCPPGTDAAGLAQQLNVDDGNPLVATAPLLGTDAATRAGILLFGHAYLSELAWARRYANRDGAYSIVGTVFAYASPRHREVMAQSLLAPVNDWDALVCSSTTLRTTVEAQFDEWSDYLGERMGARAVPRPQLPVIPFGAETDRLAQAAGDCATRQALRAELGATPDDVVVLSLGRLSFYDKAFPQAMLKAVEAAQARSEARVHFVMTGWFPQGDLDRARYEEAARVHAPSVNFVILDGNDPSVVAASWAAADIFMLLSDTILETFGMAVVEAMAAGLPVVVSDWDGYRDIVRDGVDGFRIPTMGGPPGRAGEALANLDSFGQVSYVQYAGAVSQHTAVHLPRAFEVLTELVASPELRHRLGESGQRRAREVYDWSVVVRDYQKLFAELTDRRLAAVAAGRASATGHRINPLRADPFADFAGLPSTVLDDRTVISVAAPPRLPKERVELDDMYPGLRGTDAEAEQVLRLLAENGPTPLGEVVGQFPARRRPFVRMTVMWLAKAGFVDWLSASQTG